MMMRRVIFGTHVLLLLFLSLSLFQPAWAQPAGGIGFSVGEGTKGESAKKEQDVRDSYVLRYNFSQGESITYRVLSFDSIVVWDTEPRILLRQRVERMTYRCDTILPEGYGMSLTLDDAVVRERLDTLPWMLRTEHPWVGEPIKFLMKEDGERIRLRDTMATPGSMPGAPFQPLLIPHLGGIDTVSIGAGSVFERKMWLLDNVYPPVQWQGGGYRKILGAKDTLGHHALAVELSEVGQVWYTPPAVPGQQESAMTTHTRLNGGGIYWIDFDAGYPVAGEYQLMGNITFENTATKQERKGRHTISMEFAIDSTKADLKEVFQGEE